VVNLHSSYKVTKNFEVFGLVQNLFNQHYYATGTFFDTQGIAFQTFNDPRTFIPACRSPPMRAYVRSFNVSIRMIDPNTWKNSF